MSKFELGKIVATPGALDALARAGQYPLEFLLRHVQGDWGDLDAEDKQMNEQACAHEDNPEKRTRVFSAYVTKLGDRLWIITEHDRSVTTLLLPDEY